MAQRGREDQMGSMALMVLQAALDRRVRTGRREILAMQAETAHQVYVEQRVQLGQLDKADPVD